MSEHQTFSAPVFWEQYTRASADSLFELERRLLHLEGIAQVVTRQRALEVGLPAPREDGFSLQANVSLETTTQDREPYAEEGRIVFRALRRIGPIVQFRGFAADNPSHAQQLVDGLLPSFGPDLSSEQMEWLIEAWKEAQAKTTALAGLGVEMLLARAPFDVADNTIKKLDLKFPNGTVIQGTWRQGNDAYWAGHPHLHNVVDLRVVTAGPKSTTYDYMHLRDGRASMSIKGSAITEGMSEQEAQAVRAQLAPHLGTVVEMGRLTQANVNALSRAIDAALAPPPSA